MGFIERLKREDIARAQQLRTQQEARERERLQKEADELKYRTQRRMQAEQYRQESGIEAVVGELANYLETPTIPVKIPETRDGFTEMVTHYQGRGARGLPGVPIEVWEHRHFTDVNPRGHLPALNLRDQDSVLNAVHWDHNIPMGYGTIKSSYKYVMVESCPDGNIVFHGGLFGSTTFGLIEWRIKDKEQLFDRALEKAFRHPALHRYSFYRSEPMGFG